MTKGTRFQLLTLALGVLSACSGGTGPAGNAQLRVLHATPALGPIDVEIGGVRVIQGIGYGTASTLVQVPGGQQHLVVRSGGTILGELDARLALSHVNSVVIAGGTPQFSEVVFPDTGVAISNRANLRMVNVVGSNSSPPTLLSVLLKAPDAQNPDSVVRFGMDAQVASYGTLLYFNPGHFEIKYVPAGGTTVLAEASFDVAAGEKKALVLERAADGTYRVLVVVEQ